MWIIIYIFFFSYLINNSGIRFDVGFFICKISVLSVYEFLLKDTTVHRVYKCVWASVCVCVLYMRWQCIVRTAHSNKRKKKTTKDLLFFFIIIFFSSKKKHDSLAGPASVTLCEISFSINFRGVSGWK